MNHILSTGEPGYDHEMTIMSGPCGSLSVIADVDAAMSGGTESILFYPTNGTQYHVYIAYWSTGGSSSQTGTFTISRICYPIPANDECSNATSLPCGTVDLAGTTYGVMPETAPGSGSDYGVWYEFTGNDQATTISSVGTTLDHKLTIMSGSCGALSVIANVDGAMSGGTETYTFHTISGTQYYIYVTYYLASGSNIGTFTISRSCFGEGTDICNDATAFALPCGGSYSDAATTNQATNTG